MPRSPFLSLQPRSIISILRRPPLLLLLLLAVMGEQQITALAPSNQPQLQMMLTTSLSMSGNFGGRMSRYGGGRPGGEEEQNPQPELSWDWDDEDPNNNNNNSNDDMFAPQHQEEHPPLATTAEGDDLPSEDIQGAQLTDEMKYRAHVAHFDEKEVASQGGSKFREAMLRAKQTVDSVMQPPEQQQQQQHVQIPTNPMDLSIEEQASLFRQLMMERQQQMNPNGFQQPQDQQQDMYPQQGEFQKQEQQQVSSDPYAQAMAEYQQQQQPQTDPYSQPPADQYGQQQQQQQLQPPKVHPPPPPPDQPEYQGPPQNYRVYGTGYDGKKIGRNRDADIVSNSADAYFARLKRDSTSRNYARYAGDDNSANAVFHDPAIWEIEAPVNPYLVDQRERERQMVDTVPEEMLLFEQEEPERATPLSYRDQLAQYQQQQQQEQQQQQQSDGQMNQGY